MRGTARELVSVRRHVLRATNHGWLPPACRAPCGGVRIPFGDGAVPPLCSRPAAEVGKRQRGSQLDEIAVSHAERRSRWRRRGCRTVHPQRLAAEIKPCRRGAGSWAQHYTVLLRKSADGDRPGQSGIHSYPDVGQDRPEHCPPERTLCDGAENDDAVPAA
jgi:hypothetical protein